jgi:transcriptional regulator with XRE-family HTH domain
MGRHPSRRHTTPEEAPVGQRIRQRRRELGLTQAELAGPEYTKSFISQLEGGYADPSLDTLRFLGRRLELALSSMAGDPNDQRLALLAGLLAWAHGAILHGRDAAARHAIALAKDIAQEAGAHLHTADALLLQADLELAAGAPDRAQSAVDEAGRLPVPPGSRLAMRTQIANGRLALRRGDTAGAVSAFRRALGPGRKTTRHPDMTAQAMTGLAAAALRDRDTRQARRRLQSVVTLANRHRLDAWRGRALVRLAWIDRLEGDSGRAVDRLREGEGVLRATTDRRGAVEASLSLGLLLVEEGQLAEGRRLLQAARETAGQAGDQRREGEAAIALARVALAEGDVDAAAREASVAQRVADALSDTAMRGRADAVAAHTLGAGGRQPEIVQSSGDAVGRPAPGPAEVSTWTWPIDFV